MPFKLPNGFRRYVSIASGMVLAFVAGTVIGHFRWGPARLVGLAEDVVRDLAANAEAYLGAEPVQHLRPSRFERSGARALQPERVAPGVTFVTGLFGETLGARLYGSDGTLLYEWPVSFFDVAPEEMAFRYDALLHGDHLFENGDFAANLDGRGMVRVSACGDVVWRNRDRSHHAIDIDENGDLWAPVNSELYDEPRFDAEQHFRMDLVARFDPETGEKLEEIDLVEAVLDSDLVGLALTNRILAGDVMHLNDVDVLRSDMAAAFPMFSAGDVLLSSRHFNQLWVVDRTTHRIKWWFAGPLHGQHDPDFQPDGTITVLDNQPAGPALAENGYRGYRDGSRILSIDPATGRHEVLYASDDRNAFYTPFRGKHQLLENGNLLIAETDAGRAFEVAPNGEVVWSFVNRWDETRVAWVMSATRYPERHAAVAETVCPA